jgi:tetratricopeptide (TPR) repeat protein
MTLELSGSIIPTLRIALVIAGAMQLASCGSSAERAQSYYDNGVKLVAKHENQKAAIEFKNAIDVKRDMIPAWRGLAQIEEADHHWDALVPVLQTIVQLDPHDVKTKLKLARLLLAGGATDRALALVNGVEPRAAPDADMTALRAAIFYKLKDSNRALHEAQAALALEPGNIDAIIVVAAIRLDSGDAQGALRILDGAPHAHANDLGVQVYKLKVFEQLADTSQIETTLRKLLTLHPEQAVFRKQLIKFYIDQHRLGDAESELRKVAQSNAKDTDSELDLVRFLYKVKGYAVAHQELSARIEAGGNVFPYQMALSDLDYAHGNVADAAKLLEVLANGPNSPEDSRAAKIKLAEINIANKNIDAAEAILADVLRRDGRDPRALKLRAAIRMERGQLDSAIVDLRQALDNRPRAADLMLQLAIAYERRGDIELAEKQFAEAFRASGFEAAVGLNYVAFLRRRGSLERADDILTDLAARQPMNLSVLSALAEVRLARQDWGGAQEIGEAMRRIGGNNSVADEIIGAALNGQQKYAESIAAFQNAVAAAPQALQPMVLLVRSLVRAKQTDRAVSFLQTVLKSNPANAEAYVLLGSIARTNGALDQAANSFMAAIDKQPNNSIGYRALAELYLAQNKTNAALATLRAGLKLQPDNAILHMALAAALERADNYDAAISEYEYVLAQQPGSLVAINNLASLLADHRTDKASLERAQALAASLRHSQVPQFKDTLGWVDYRNGDVKAAVPLLEEAAAALPDQAAVRYHLGMSYVASGQGSRASREFKVALSKAPSAALKQAITAEVTKITTQ